MLLKVKHFCLENITNACINKRLTVVKTVRLSARTLVHLMQHIPNLKVIHLVRNPKAVSSSRAKQPWAMLYPNSEYFINANAQKYPIEARYFYHKTSQKANSSTNLKVKDIIVSEASRYCEQTLDDMHVLMNIAKQYPNSLFRLVYEDFIKYRSAILDKIYNFVGTSPSPNIYLWLEDQNSTSKIIAAKWKYRMTPDISYEIENVCLKLYEKIQF
jgi:hypothetical protein